MVLCIRNKRGKTMTKNQAMYLMIAGSKPNEDIKWMTLQDAGALYDYGTIRVEIGGHVTEPTGKVRRMTHVDQKQISNTADEYSASK